MDTLTYVAPAFAAGDHTDREDSGVAQFVAVIAVILVYFAAVLAWCYFVCRGSGGLQSCDVGWFTATATCKQ
jgi:hypothetical protein